MNPIYALIDLNTRAVLTLSQNVAIIIELRKFVSNCVWVADVRYPNYYKNPLPFDQDNPSGYASWTWSSNARQFEKMKPELITPELTARSLLLSAQRNAFMQVMTGLSLISMRVGTGVANQDMIYAQKLKEAEAFKAAPASDALRWFPYVLQHAELNDLSMEQAADDIIFAAKLTHDTLVRVEGLRLTYFQRIRDAQTVADTLPILTDFKDEIHGNALQ